jgi:lipopolysaccharide export system protein LptA
VTNYCLFGGINPFSKITITSQKATCQRDISAHNVFLFNYINNVQVIFADGSKITSEKLKIIFSGENIVKGDKKISVAYTVTPKKDFFSRFKKIIFLNKVCLISQNRLAFADYAELFPKEKICKLKGHVKIQQTKVEKRDVPIVIESSQAMLNLETKELSFVGSLSQPVSTVIELDDCINLDSHGKESVKGHDEQDKTFITARGTKNCSG